MTAALPRFGDDQALFLELLAEFSERLPADIQQLEAAVEAQNADDLTQAAHKLKGACATFGAERLTGLAQSLETASRLNDLTEAVSLLNAIKTESIRLLAYQAQLAKS
jgi:HPt (histidine-containing phosphotransfer) domain-containing protein